MKKSVTGESTAGVSTSKRLSCCAAGRLISVLLIWHPCARTLASLIHHGDSIQCNSYNAGCRDGQDHAGNSECLGTDDYCNEDYERRDAHALPHDIGCENPALSFKHEYEEAEHDECSYRSRRDERNDEHGDPADKFAKNRNERCYSSHHA